VKYCALKEHLMKLTRKNLMLDQEQVRELARLRGTSESEAVRQAVAQALMADEVMLALRELRDQGGIDDVFGRADSRDGA
jgi:hypothetical protein